MARGKTSLKLIESPQARQVTFAKRRNGILKKAFELSVLTAAEVAIIIYSQKGKLFEFGSNNSDVFKTIERYKSFTNANFNQEELVEVDNTQAMQKLQEELTDLNKKLELVEARKRKLFGENLDGSSVDELLELENSIERGLRNIRQAKSWQLEDQIERLKEQNNLLSREKEELLEKFQLLQQNKVGFQKNENRDANQEPSSSNHPATLPGNQAPRSSNHPATFLPANQAPSSNNYPVTFLPANQAASSSNHPVTFLPANQAPSSSNHPATFLQLGLSSW